MILRLGPTDLDRFNALLDMFGSAFEEPATYGDARPDAGYLADLLSDPTFVALAAVEANTVIGGLVAYELRKFEQRRSEFYIYDLAVAEPYRRKGIATGLIEALKPIARARGGYVIFVQADHVDPPAIAL
jgi:aminoglycoside 3-N-acetyltransferase I